MISDQQDPTAGTDTGTTDWFAQNAPTTPNLVPIPNMPGGFYDPATGDLYSNGQKVGGHYDAGSNQLTDPTGKTFTPGAGTQIPDAPTGANTGLLTPSTPTDPTPPGPSPVTGPTAGRTLGLPETGFGAMPATYQSNPNAPAYTPLAPYQPPMWTGGDYQNPTEADLLASPGYQARLDRGLQGQARQFAAQGTILNGGTLKALDRYSQDYASNEYQTLRNNTFEAYKQRYGQFQDAAGMNLGARTINANENLNTFANRTSQYQQGNQRTLSDYLTNLSARRNAENDYWGRLQDLNQTGAGLAGNSR